MSIAVIKAGSLKSGQSKAVTSLRTYFTNPEVVTLTTAEQVWQASEYGVLQPATFAILCTRKAHKLWD